MACNNARHLEDQEDLSLKIYDPRADEEHRITPSDAIRHIQVSQGLLGPDADVRRFKDLDLDDEFQEQLRSVVGEELLPFSEDDSHQYSKVIYSLMHKSRCLILLSRRIPLL